MRTDSPLTARGQLVSFGCPEGDAAGVRYGMRSTGVLDEVPASTAEGTRPDDPASRNSAQKASAECQGCKEGWDRQGPWHWDSIGHMHKCTAQNG